MAKIKKKITKTMLSPEEEIKSITHTVSEYYQVYRKQANMAVALIALVLIVALVYSLVQAGNEKKSGQLFAAAYDAYAPGGGAPAKYPLALQRFQDVVKQYSGTANGALAAFYIGNTYAGMGQPDAALKEYEAFTKKHAGETFLLGMVYQRIGYAYLALGKRDEAVKAFAQAETLSGTGPATVELARLYDLSGNSQEAAKKYKAISADIPSTTWASEARSKLPPPDLGQAMKKEQPGSAAK
jgi:tetratricopeptide (TPR) repeat protein